MPGKSGKNGIKRKSNQARHYFFLNPYEDTAFTRCPKCEDKTKIRKYCLLIHIDPKHLFSLNKTCKYCTNCDLIIVKKVDIENLLVAICEEFAPEIIGNDYFIYGTMKRKDWEKGQMGKISQQEGIKLSHPFKNVWKFEMRPRGWYPDEQVKTEK